MSVLVAILAGGEGRRIGGGKPLRTLHGESLIERALRHARNWSDAIVIAIRDPAQVEVEGVALVRDAEVPGPLGGLITALGHASGAGHPMVLSIPADMPFLPRDLFDRLSSAIGDGACALAASGGQLHPVCGLWRSSALGQALDYAGSGRRSLKGLAESVGFAVAQWPAEPNDPFFNVNTSEDLAEAARRAR